MPRIDVAIPNYNYGRFLRGCVESVQNQDVADLRILIIDNASTDDSAIIAREIAASDPRVELCLNTINLGAHASFNRAIDWAESDYFTIVCSDDWLPMGSLRKSVSALDRYPDANLVFGETMFIEDGKSLDHARGTMTSTEQYITGGDFLYSFCETGRSPVRGPMTVVRTAVQKRLGYYRPDLPHTDDMEMWMRFAAAGAVVKLDDVQSIVRIHGANQSAILQNVHHWNVESEAAFEAFFRDHGASLADADLMLRKARRSLSDRAYWCAVSHFLRGDPGVRELINYAIRLHPMSALLPPIGYLWRRPDLISRVKQLFGGRRIADATGSI
ncbi:glycosyltransferase family 2 protein [Phyllobacterium endophyticum]|uniref:Glycosyltransferase family 2 protein n=1 Tax=Phyllobacterium endophyticum TaxID=1149773 RepID=A0A2P7B0W5_9HYPH|nr:glycosyltransferase family A protein [Phyllobacterium endophyticum]MBB3237636.1 glycosyltransferase involved in cell wall biosynthesis [Phyllobacterium endophyticum]PSH60105.1 glycosyltransferase family 2 protein [Phyllobacterium endophyticum]TYR42272.1 glycosyltransferase family 2 protein [Phyllobacterium endophyticum]